MKHLIDKISIKLAEIKLRLLKSKQVEKEAEPEQIVQEHIEKIKEKKLVARKIRKHLLQAIASANAFLMFFLLLFIGLITFARFGALTNEGRAEIESRLDGMKLGNIGTLNIEGVEGDFFTNFKVKKISINDEKGPWIDGQNLEIAWSPIELFLRKIHVENAKFGYLKIYRKPQIKKSGKKLNFTIEIDKLIALIETKEEVSVKSGLFGAALNLNINRNHNIEASGALISAKRRNDRIIFAISAIEKKPLLIKIDANEANGGPIAGLLGLPNQSFSIFGNINASYKYGVLDISGQSANQNLIKINGNWNEIAGKIDGNANLALSKYSAPLAKLLGDRPTIFGQWRETKKDLLQKNQFYNGEFSLIGQQSKISLNGDFNLKEKKIIDALNLSLRVNNLSQALNLNKISIGNMVLDAKIGGGIKNYFIDGNYKISNANFGRIFYQNISGNLSLEKAKKSILGNINAQAFGPENELIIGQLFGTNPKINLEFENNNNFLVKNFALIGKSIKVNAKSGLNIFSKNINGNVSLLAPAVSKNQLNGIFEGDFNAKIIDNKFLLDGIAIGKNLKSKSNIVNRFLGDAPKLKANLSLSKSGLNFDKFIIYGQDIEFTGSGISKPNPFAILKGQLKMGDKALNIFEAKGSAFGDFEFSGLDGKSPFNLFLNLSTKDFATPVGIINQYFGDKPKFKGNLILEPKRILLEKTDIVSQNARAQFIGQLAGANGYALMADWQLLVPFTIGNFEIGGNPKGSAIIKGPSQNPIIEVFSKIEKLEIYKAQIRNADFKAYINTAIKPIPTDLYLKGQTDFGAINAQAKLFSQNDDLDLKNINISGSGIAAIGSAKFPKKQNPNADFSFIISKGLFLKSGQLKGDLKLTKNGNDTFANIFANGQNFSFTGSNLLFEKFNIFGNGSLKNLVLDTEFKTSNSASLSFKGKTQIEQKNDVSNISINGSGNILGRYFTTFKPLNFTIKDEIISGDGKLNLNANANIESGYLDYKFKKQRQNFDLITNLENINFSLFDSDFNGFYSGKFALFGNGNSLESELKGDINKLRARGINEKMGLSGKIDATLKNGAINLILDASNEQGLKIDTNVKMGAIGSNAPIRIAIDKSAPLKGNISVNGEMRPLTDLIFAGERTLTGIINLDAKLDGSLLKPEFYGNFDIKNGTYREPKIGLHLPNLNLVGNIFKDKIKIENLYAKDARGGDLNGFGEVQIDAISKSNFTINTKKFRLIDNDIAKIDATGKVQINSDIYQKGKMSGNLNIDFAEFRPRTLAGVNIAKLDVIEINKPIPKIENFEKNPLQIVKSNYRQINAPDIDLDVNIKAERGIFVRGRGLNLELSLNGNINGKLAKPNLEGIAKVYRGEYEYGGRIFEFEERGNIHLSSNPANIRLDLYANRIADNLNAKISVKGTALNPIIDLTSIPDLPKDEILSQVLFGRARSQLTPLETVQLATSLAALASGGGFDVMANLREIARLDRLVFANTASGEISVAGGKYLGRDIYIELISEGTQGISTNVEWRPKPSTAIVSKVGADGDAKISIRWRRDIK